MSLEKTWLIRTKNHHLLGPVSQKKIQELISNNSIKGEDEVCSGNGYWFFIREQELVAKYIFGNEKQDFNPVQESEPVLTAENAQNEIESAQNDETLLPSDNDLDYPEIDDITTIGVSLNQIMSEDADIPEIPEKKKPVPKKKANLNTVAPKKTPIKKTASRGPKTKLQALPITAQENKTAQLLSGKFLIIVTFVFVILGLLLLYFRGSVVKKMIELTHFSPISSVHAQTIGLDKKKTGLI